jgi:hypothetical protein
LTPKTPQQIQLHIEELLLYGFAPQDRHLIAEAVQRELTRLLVTGQAQGSAPFYEEKIPHNIEIPRLDGGTFHVQHGAQATDIGKQVAHAIYGGIKRV